MSSTSASSLSRGILQTSATSSGRSPTPSVQTGEGLRLMAESLGLDVLRGVAALVKELCRGVVGTAAASTPLEPDELMYDCTSARRREQRSLSFSD